VLNERRRRAVKLHEVGVTVRETARQCELSTHTVVEAHKAFRLGGWDAVKVRQSGRGYAPKGQTPVVRANAARQSLSVISTVTNKGQMRWKVFSGALNAKILIHFLERLTRQQKKKIFLILDNLRVHHSKLLREWLEANAKKIEVSYLPSYSPELNPDELLNADLKHRVTSAALARNKIALTKTAAGAPHSIQKLPQRVKSYFSQKEVCYAAA